MRALEGPMAVCVGSCPMQLVLLLKTSWPATLLVALEILAH